MATPSKRSSHANQVRLIGGDFRRRRLFFPDAPGLRPTPDRVRETLFNWLGQDLTGMACLDAFAGSGALGFEAASRNASRVVMLESSRDAVEVLKKNQEMLDARQVEIVQANAITWMKRCQARFDLVFLDPPFSGNMMGEAMPLAVGLLNADGWVYVEAPASVIPPDGFIIHREGTAGLSHFALLRRA